jgi:hypothetical protein
VKHTALIISFSLLILCLSLFNITLYYKNHNEKTSVLGKEAQSNPNLELKNQKVYWKLSSNPTYLDGWIELTQINYKLQNKNDFLISLKMAEEINPISPKLQEVKITTSSL